MSLEKQISSSAMSSPGKRSNKDIKEIITKAQDDIVNVNSLFTVAVFLGLSVASPDPRILESGREECQPDAKMQKRLVVYEVVSFSCFLISSLVAKSLKIFITIFYPDQDSKNSETSSPRKNPKLSNPTRGIMFTLIVLASNVGVLFLTISMVYIVEVKIGKLSCGIAETRAAIIALIVLVSCALTIYLPSVFAALVCCIIEP